MLYKIDVFIDSSTARKLVENIKVWITRHSSNVIITKTDSGFEHKQDEFSNGKLAKSLSKTTGNIHLLEYLTGYKI